MPDDLGPESHSVPTTTEVLTVQRAADAPVTLGVVLVLLSGVMALLAATYHELGATKDKLNALHVEHSKLAERFESVHETLTAAKQLLATRNDLNQFQTSTALSDQPGSQGNVQQRPSRSVAKVRR